MPSSARRLLCSSLLLAALATACGGAAPTVTLASVKLVKYPSPTKLAAYYCPQILTGIASHACSVIGSVPRESEMAFTFATTLAIDNPNDFPVPAADVLLSLTLFQGQQDNVGLAAVCVSFCSSDDPSCDGTPKPGACTASSGQSHTLADYSSGTDGLIQGVDSGAQGSLAQPEAAAKGTINVTLSLSLGVAQALKVIKNVVAQLFTSITKLESLSLSIPISVEGAVFFELPLLGRVGVNFGPFSDTWNIP